jgi:hypothetical protein
MGGVNSDRTSTPRSDVSPERRHRRRIGALALALLASWLLMLMPLPVSLLAGVTGLVSLVLLVLVVVQSVRDGRWSMAVIGAFLGLPATLMIIAGAVLSTIFYGPLADLEDCRATAITEQARVKCDAEAQGSMVEWLSGALGG